MGQIMDIVNRRNDRSEKYDGKTGAGSRIGGDIHLYYLNRHFIKKLCISCCDIGRRYRKYRT